MLTVLSNSSSHSGRMLAREIRNRGHECYSVRDPEKIKRWTFVIRYGSTALHSGIDTINTLEVIRTCSNKLLFSQLMKDNEIYSPEFYKGVPKQYPVITRSTLSSFGGRGMELVRSEKEFINDGTYWTPFIETAFELRVHVLGSKISRIFRKEGGESFIRTSSNGWHFALKDPQYYPKLFPLVEKICGIPMFANAFIALDIGWDAKRREYLVYEGNSAPGLNEHTAGVYAEYILDRLNKVYR